MKTWRSAFSPISFKAETWVLPFEEEFPPLPGSLFHICLIFTKVKRWGRSSEQNGIYEVWNQVKGSRICHSSIWHFGILSCSHLKNSKYRKGLPLNSPYKSKDMSSQRTSVFINPFLKSVINQERPSLVTGEMTRSLYHTQKNCHKLSYLLSILLRTHVFFLKIVYCSPRCLYSPSSSPLRWHLSLIFKLPQGLLFPWVSPLCIHEVYMLKSLCVFLLSICLLLQGSQPRT